jgi:tRNA (guanine37-N1)-methyltransferase
VRITIVTIFPEMFPAFLDQGMVRVAREKGLLDVQVVNLRDFTKDRHRTTDDAPFGGGVGMVMLAEPIFRAIEAVAPDRAERHVVLATPQGRPFRQDDARRLATLPHVVVLCGRYKGIDERVAEQLVDEELSLGDFVLSGGEPFAACVVDAVARLLPGVLGDFDSAESDSFHSGLLDCAYYSRPADFAGSRVPDVLLSGDHARIARWRRENALARTFARRPDLLAGAALDAADRKFIRTLSGEPEPEAPAPRARQLRARGAEKPPKETS